MAALNRVTEHVGGAQPSTSTDGSGAHIASSLGPVAGGLRVQDVRHEPANPTCLAGVCGFAGLCGAGICGELCFWAADDAQGSH